MSYISNFSVRHKYRAQNGTMAGLDSSQYNTYKNLEIEVLGRLLNQYNVLDWLELEEQIHRHSIRHAFFAILFFSCILVIIMAEILYDNHSSHDRSKSLSEVF